MRALVVEDNLSHGRLVERVLADAGVDSVLASTAHMGQFHGLSDRFDLIILDVVLPDGNGLDLCRWLRERGVCTPVLILSMLGSVADRVRGLDAGADDYLAKPFEPAELLARVRALVRRGSRGVVSVRRVADVEMDLLSRTVRRGERAITLTTREFALLEFFMHHPDRVLSRSEIGTHVWGMNFDPHSNLIEVFVSALRRKLGEPSLIQTRIGAGYLLVSSPAQFGHPRSGA